MFKCVSKLWFSLIRSRFFSNRYSAVASPPRPTRRVYMSFMEHIYCESMDLCPKPRNSLLQLFSSSSLSSKFDKDSSLPGMGGRINVVFRGLLLYNVCRKACIYNPTSRQRVILPIVESNIFAQDEFCKNVGYFFGYDPVLDQYKILCTVVISSEKLERITSEHWVFVLEAGGMVKTPHAVFKFPSA
ncbi:unnamed protein product [Arabis nemorensis]|uniref:F-box associated beta-propeller type 3 domain-containing protein n=1 Tax=Arabis nemorensis TaxID=586526 RepID=A0A565B9Y2_9BRAS|nr:unnamed protein product [Arabis nemorensis]